MNKVLLSGRLTRDPELRLTIETSVTEFVLATTDQHGQMERTEYHNVVVWDRLAQVCAEYLGKGTQVAVEGYLQTRTWDDDRGARHFKTEVVATAVQMLSGRRKKDFNAEPETEGGAVTVGELGLPYVQVGGIVQSMGRCLVDRGHPEAEVREALARWEGEDAFWTVFLGPAVDALGDSLGLRSTDEL